MERHKKINKDYNTKMKKTNENNCVITRIWPTLDDVKKDLFIDLEKQQVIKLSTGKVLKQRSNGRYIVINFSVNRKFKNIRLHRLFFYWHNGFLPPLVDHKDRNMLNNNIQNLRELDQSGNRRNANKRKGGSSKYKGVSFNKESNKWESKIMLDKKRIFLGYFDDEDDAGQAYNDAIRKYGLEDVSVLNDTPQERARKNIQFDPLPQEMNHIKDLFLNIEPLVDFK